MFAFEKFNSFECGDMTVVYLTKDGKMMFSVFPTAMQDKIVKHNDSIDHELPLRGCCAAKPVHFDPRSFENMIQFHIQGDGFSNMYIAGDSMLENMTARNLEFVEQYQDGDCIKTVMKCQNREIYATQTLTVFPGKNYFTVNTEVENRTDNSVILDHLASFMLGNISPFAFDDGNDRYFLHRKLAFWSAEGRSRCDAVEDLGLERSWQASVGRVERFGQRSSMAVKKNFPFAALEDRAAGVVWAAQMCALGPWQMELLRKGDFLNLAGGVTDREFAGFEKMLAPGEKFAGVPAVITVVQGSVQEAMNRLASYIEDTNIGYSVNESDVPVIFNEWCTNWGVHDEEKLIRIAEKIKGRNIKYFVLDAGWFTSEGCTEKNPAWHAAKGDWIVNKYRFPNGIKHYCDKIRELGFIPGIWFEMEQVNHLVAQMAKEHHDFFIQCHGVPYTTDGRTYVLDFRKKEVRDFMHTKVTDFLIANNIGYIKTDYNYTLVGADSASGSIQYGLYEWYEGVRTFFREMKERVPELTLEICASGGHRLTAEWLRIGDMASVTDAHENASIPLIVSETAMQIPLRSNQVWAVFHDWDDEKRFRYLLAGGFIGRLCISGDIFKLSDEQMSWVQEGIDFYGKLKSLVLCGSSKVDKFLQNKSWSHPEGYQFFYRENEAQLYIILHTFEKAPSAVEVAVPAGAVIKDVFKSAGISVDFEKNKIKISNLSDYCGMALLLNK